MNKNVICIKWGTKFDSGYVNRLDSKNTATLEKSINDSLALMTIAN